MDEEKTVFAAPDSGAVAEAHEVEPRRWQHAGEKIFNPQGRER